MEWASCFFTKIASTSPNTHANSAPVSQLQLVHFVHGYSRTTSVCSVFVCLYQVVTGWNHSESDLSVMDTWLGEQLKLAVRLCGVMHCLQLCSKPVANPKGSNSVLFLLLEEVVPAAWIHWRVLQGWSCAPTIRISFPACRWDPLANNVLTLFIRTLAVPGSLPSLACPSTAHAVWHVSWGEQLLCCLVFSMFCSEISGTVKLFLC